MAMTFDEELKNADTLRAIFAAINKHYDTDSKLPLVKEIILKAGIRDALKTSNIRKR